MKSRKVVTDDEVVESRLRLFVNKYYRIKIIQGLIISVSVALILVSGLIVFGNIIPVEKVVRNMILVIADLFIGIVCIIYVIRPLAQRFGFIRGLNFKEASAIIQQKHKSVEDRIINIIELTREKAGTNNRLYDYAIAQKTGNIRDINFDDAISLKKLGMIILRLGMLMALCLGTVFIWPDFVKKGFGIMLARNSQIDAMRSIKFEILNDTLQVESGKDFLLEFKVISGFPVENVAILIGSTQEKPDRVKEGYEFLFKAVNSSVSFRLSGNGTVSGEYVLNALKKPEIASIRLKVIPPSYTAMESKIIEGDGNAEVPAGSRIIWSVKTVNTDELIVIGETDTVRLTEKGNSWTYEKEITKNNNYGLLCRNNNGLFVNYLYKISVVRDLFPTIDISESRDSTVSDDIYIQGIIQDDYGFSKLEIVEDKLGVESIKPIKINESNIYESFYYTLVPDSTQTFYYFRVWDNDRVTGPKFTESRKISIKIISKEEIENINSQLVDSIKTNMAQGMNAIEKLEKKVSQFKMEQVLGDLKPWEIQEKMKELTDLKKEVVDFIENISKDNKTFTENENILNQDKEFNEKAKQIQDLMQNLLDDELKDLLKQFEELAKEFNAKKADELTDKMEMNLDKLKEQMEMSLELLKKYNMEKDLMKQVDQLNQMADSLQNNKDKDEGQGNQLKEEFKKWENKYEEQLKQDKELKKPMGLKDMEQEREEVRKDAQELDKKDSGNQASKKKAKTAKSLKDLAKKMGDMLGMMSGEGEFVDLEDLRQIRNSLNDFSKKQEDLNNRISGINGANPVFRAVIKEQKELQDKFLSVRDSLKSIGYKQPVVAKIIGAELFHVETSLKNLFDSYDANQINVVRLEQNQIMSEVNSIAVKLDELIRSMELSKGSGQGNKGFMDRKKPSEGDQKGSQKLQQTKSRQESLKEQLKSAIEQMNGKSAGKKERGELARMLGEREMMRKALEKVLQEGSLGMDAKQKANEALNMMKEVEKDIIYNRLGDQTLEKDNLIRTKLLDAENAERERENENRRESKEFKGSFEPDRRLLDKGTDQNKALEQMLKYNELKLKRFYQEKYLKYLESTKK